MTDFPWLLNERTRRSIKVWYSLYFCVRGNGELTVRLRLYCSKVWPTIRYALFDYNVALCVVSTALPDSLRLLVTEEACVIALKLRVEEKENLSQRYRNVASSHCHSDTTWAGWEDVWYSLHPLHITVVLSLKHSLLYGRSSIEISDRVNRPYLIILQIAGNRSIHLFALITGINILI